MVRVAVVGTGYLGRFHLEKYLALDGCVVTGIVEVDPEARRAISERYNVPGFADVDELPAVDAVSIVVPTRLHASVAGRFLSRGVHCFIEKPVADTAASARQLAVMAAPGVVVQVGHIERFNPAFNQVLTGSGVPRMLSLRRKAPFTPRGADVDVVYDLMIHDIDLVTALLPGREVAVRNVHGLSLVTDQHDILAVDLDVGGVPVHIEASRVHPGRERCLTVLSDNGAWEADLGVRTVMHRPLRDDERQWSFPTSDPLMDELASFLRSIAEGTPAAVTLDDGIRALDIAESILAAAGAPA